MPSAPPRPHARRTAARAATCCVAAGALLAGCSSEQSPQLAATSERSLTPAERLAAAKKQIDDAKTVHIVLTSKDVPSNASGPTAADGWGFHPPAFKGTFTVSVKGITGDAQLTALDGEVWAKLPLVPGTNKINPQTFGMPDPAMLLSPDTGLTTWLTATTNPTAGSQTRVGSEVLDTVTGQLPGRKVTDMLVIGDPNASFTATYKLTEANQLRAVEIAGPFYGAGTSSTYAVTFDGYNAPQTISKP